MKTTSGETGDPLDQACAALHVGFSKTGTTTLQRHLFMAHPGILYLGKPYGDSLIREGFLDLLVGDSGRGDPNALREAVSREQGRALSTGRRLLLSEELCLSASKVRDKEEVARRIRAVFGPCKIMITIRRQPDILRAAYLSGARPFPGAKDRWRGGNLSFLKWLQISYSRGPQSYVGHVDYRPSVEIYAQHFGRGNTAVFLLEELRDDLEAYGGGLAAYLGIDRRHTLACLRDKHENREPARSRGDSRRLTGRLASASGRNAATGVIGRMIRARSRPLGRGPVDLDFPETWQGRLTQLYGDGNRSLAREYGLPLAQYGYPL